MPELKAEEFDPPYLLLLGDTADATHAKTALGILQWQPERVLGQLRFAACKIDLGIPDLSPAEACQRGARSLIVGVAPAGGVIPEHWWQCIEEAAACGLDIVSGLHTRLVDRPSLVRIAGEQGVRLIDIRVPPKNIPVATGRKRSGKRLLTVGTDCAIGKKYTALAVHAAMRKAGIDATFRATGQTGIMLAGGGIPIDAVVADFVAGAAEMLSPDNDPDHWDVIEGQGTLFHPAYSGVSLSLLHGSQPDAIVVAHDATRTRVSGWNDFELPSVSECIELHLLAGRRTNPAILCAGVSVNTSGLHPDDRIDWLSALSDHTGLPCFDPLLDGCSEVVHFLQEHVVAAS
jgi:uncharacterized NAD-dependent epimerase/dehydratase family protein